VHNGEQSLSQRCGKLSTFLTERCPSPCLGGGEREESCTLSACPSVTLLDISDRKVSTPGAITAVLGTYEQHPFHCPAVKDTSSPEQFYPGKPRIAKRAKRHYASQRF